MLRNKTLKSQSQYILLNVFNYFERNLPNEATLNAERTAEACGVSVTVVMRTRARFRDAEAAGTSVLRTPQKKRRRKKSKSVDVPEYVKDAVKREIYGMHSKLMPVTVRSLADKLKQEDIFEFKITSLRLLLTSIGFKYSTDDERRGLFEQPHIASARAKFLREYFSNNEEQVYDPVFLGETWISARRSARQSWHNSDKKSIRTKPTGEGKRFIVLSAGNGDGFVENALLIFASKRKSDDYHDNMDADSFKKWFMEKLVPSLKRPSIIILDNASYHCRLAKRNPTTSWKKQELIEYLINKNVPYTMDMLKVELLELAKRHCGAKKFEIDEFAQQSGHTILRLPPYHCQFNPIELIWANCKEYYNKNIGRDGFGDEKVLATWNEALFRVHPELWQKSIRAAEKNMHEWWDILKLNDSIQEPIIIRLGEDSNSDESDELVSSD